jgi:GNAT superfamily N-acetyltransferase
MTHIREAEIEEWSFIKKNADEIYFKNEIQFWEKEYFRISKEECVKQIKNKELFVLIEDENIVGFVRIKKVSTQTLSFSMLTIIEKHQNKGHGSTILSFIINKAKHENFNKITIEILCAKNWKHPQKDFLIKWYSKNGFVFKREFSFEKMYPSHTKYMKSELVFKEYCKDT